MKVLKRDYRNGVVKLKVQTLDDLWYLSRIINANDFASGVTYRKVSVGEKEGERKRVFLKIRVEKVEFQEFTDSLKILGLIVESNDERVPIGDHHSLTIGLNDELLVEKDWTNIDKNYLKRSEDAKSADLLLVACDYGDACFAVYHEYGIEYSGTLSEELGGKKEVDSFEKNRQGFIKQLLSATNDIAKQKKAKRVLVGGASMITDNLSKSYKDYDYLKDKTSFAKIGYSGESGIKELIRRGEVDKVLSNNVFSEHVQLVNKILELIGRNGKVTYGFSHVKSSAEIGSVKDLILTDKFVKAHRDEVDAVLELVQNSGGGIHIISSNTEHGEQVDNLTGISAILRF